MSKRKVLTEKQRLFLKIKAEHPDWTDTRCAKEAGYKKNTYHDPKRNVSNRVQEEFAIVMEKVGITDKRIAKLIDEGFGSKITKHLKQAEIETVNKRGERVKAYKYEAINEIDYMTRKYYAELALRAGGKLIERKKTEMTFPEGIGLKIKPEEDSRIGKELQNLFGIERKARRKDARKKKDVRREKHKEKKQTDRDDMRAEETTPIERPDET